MSSSRKINAPIYDAGFTDGMRALWEALRVNLGDAECDRRRNHIIQAISDPRIIEREERLYRAVAHPGFGARMEALIDELGAE
jgi:hypothetical protein